MTKKKCLALTRKGTQCKFYARIGPYCRIHNKIKKKKKIKNTTNEKTKKKIELEYWFDIPGSYIIRLVANKSYPFFNQKKRIEDENERWSDGDKDYVLIGTSMISYNETRGMFLHSYYMYKDFPEENKFLKGRGLDMLCRLLTKIKTRNPKLTNNTKIQLEASGGSCDGLDTIKYVNNKHKDLTSIDTRQKIKRILEIIKSRTDARHFKFVKSDMGREKTASDKLKMLYLTLCGYYRNEKLVEYYKNLSFKVTDNGDPTGVKMETTFGKLYEICKKTKIN